MDDKNAYSSNRHKLLSLNNPWSELKEQRDIYREKRIIELSARKKVLKYQLKMIDEKLKGLQNG